MDCKSMQNSLITIRSEGKIQISPSKRLAKVQKIRHLQCVQTFFFKKLRLMGMEGRLRGKIEGIEGRLKRKIEGRLKRD